MRTAGIICEYNPFHTGHKRQIDILRSMGYDCIICVMSGNYTQRGEMAIFDKYTRAESALLGGADLIVELPFPFSSLSAEGFANAGVYILSSLGVDAISFGSECGDILLLERAADAVLSREFPAIYNEAQRGGNGSASAFFEAISRIIGEDVSVLSNDILGISYVAASKRLGASLEIVPIKREGAAYNEKELSKGEYPSASAIRNAIGAADGKMDIVLSDHIPERTLQALIGAKNRGLGPVFADSVEKEILSFFRLMTPAEITARAVARSGGGEHIAEDGCGILERICHAARKADTLWELLESSYNSKYTDARINRVILFSIFAVSDRLTRSLPEYTALLGASESGRRYLSHIRKKCELPIITKPSDAPNGVQRAIGETADAFYSSAFPSKTGFDHFIKARPFMLK